MTKEILKGIAGFDDIISVEEIKGGFSPDRKILVFMSDGQKHVARLSDISCYERKLQEFNVLKKIYQSGIAMSRPIAFGILDNQSSVYQLVSYIEGQNAEKVLPNLSLDEQYHIGFNTGQMLKKLHEVDLNNHGDWAAKYGEKVARKIKEHRTSNIECPIIDEMIEALYAQMDLLKNRPITLCHGDYHVGNTILDNHNEPHIIDFNRYDYEDPWSEFNSLFFSYRISPMFAKGQVDGYFNHEIPSQFFPLVKFYSMVAAISSLVWASQFSDEDLLFMRKSVARIYDEYDQLRSDIPKWYLELR